MPVTTGTFQVLKNIQLTQDIYDMTVHCPEMAAQARPGQFAQLEASGHFLRRPISICRIDRAAGTLRFVFQRRGEGTAVLGQIQPGGALSIVGPLGRGFTIPEQGTVLFVGGGIGIPPLLEAAAQVGKRAVVLLGFQNAATIFLKEEFEALGAKALIATDDGSAGHKGFVTDLLAEAIEQEKPACVCACGPVGMLKNTAAIGEAANIPVQVSMEAHMACGMGACLVCACKTRDEQGAEHYSHVCKNGPVFDSREVVFE